MAVYVTGDVHGGLDLQKVVDWDKSFGHTLSRDDHLVIAGDFGYPWDGGAAEGSEMEWLESRSFTVLFVDGNHENYGYWMRQPCEEWHGGLVQRMRPGSPVRHLCRGEVYELDGWSIFAMGGATSTDRDLRIPGESWWPQELPDERDLTMARARLDSVGWRVDYVITHTCGTRLLPRALYPDPSWQHPDRDMLTDFLDELDDRLSYHHWYLGHFHHDRDLDGCHTVLYDRIIELGQGVWEDPGDPSQRVSV